MPALNPQTDPTVATVQGVTQPAIPHTAEWLAVEAARRGGMAPRRPGQPAPAPQAGPTAAATSTATVPNPTAPAAPAATGMAPRTAVSSPSAWENDGVMDRANSIVASGSPLMTQARADGMRTAAARGLANSSIAVGASQDAAMRYATPIAMQEAAQAASRNAIRTDAYFAGERQGADITAAMARLQAQAGFDSVARRETFSQQGIMLDREIGGRAALSAQEFAQQGQLNQAAYSAQLTQLQTQQAGQMQQLDRQIASAEGQQRAALEAQRNNLLITQEFELTRLETAFGFDQAMAATQNGYTVDLTRLQAGLQSTLQAQANSEHMERMTADFQNQTQLNAQSGLQALEQIAAQGDQRLAEQARALDASFRELTLQMNQRNSEQLASSALTVLQLETQLRASLLSNPNIPAGERAAYERAISTLGDPTRAYVSGVLGGGAPAPGGTTGMQPVARPSNIPADWIQAPDGGWMSPNGGSSISQPAPAAPGYSGGTATTPPSTPPPAGTEWVRSGDGWSTRPITTGMAPR